MNAKSANRRRGTIAACVGVVLLIATLGGCPIDADAVFTETLQAALDSATSSFVSALADYLAAN